MKKDVERTKKGQFAKGHNGNAGRTYTQKRTELKRRIVDFLDSYDFEGLFEEIFENGKVKDRLDAMTLLLKMASIDVINIDDEDKGSKESIVVERIRIERDAAN